MRNIRVVEYFCDSLKKDGTQGTGTAFLITDRKGTRVVYKGKELLLISYARISKENRFISWDADGVTFALRKS